MSQIYARLSRVWSKLKAMTLVQFSKILLLDTDLLVRSGHDLDELWPDCDVSCVAAGEPVVSTELIAPASLSASVGQCPEREGLRGPVPIS